jgi:hypothetical protein
VFLFQILNSKQLQQSIKILLLILLASFDVLAVDYSVVYVRQPRLGDNEHTLWPEAFSPASVPPGSDLMLLKPDGSEEILVEAGYGAVTDPFVSFDGKWVFYSYFPDLVKDNINSQQNNLSRLGADIYKINIVTKEIIRLTHQEFTPNTGSGNWDTSNPANPSPQYNALGYGIFNLGPAPIAGGKIIFTSNRNGFKPANSYTTLNLQLFVMDDDGKNVQLITPMTLASALHPTPLADGRVVFSSYESQGLRDQRLWGLWAIHPDGQNWEPIVSAFGHASVFHFMTQISDGKFIFEDYYNKNNFGFGTLYALPDMSEPKYPQFFSASAAHAPPILQTVKGKLRPYKLPFSPKGIYAITPTTSSSDSAAMNGQGKYTHPSAAPNNDLLVVWSDGPVNRLKRPWPFPAVDSGIYLIEKSHIVKDANQLIKLKNAPEYNEVWPRAVVPYEAIHGIKEPKLLPWLPNDGTNHTNLVKGSPYGLVGASSFYNRESSPGATVQAAKLPFDGLDEFNTKGKSNSSNWVLQGADAGKYTNEDIWAVRILAMEPFTDKNYGPGGSSHRSEFYISHARERLRILGEIPLRKNASDGSVLKDYTGDPDTSFLAKIPADVPFTFQALDRNGSVLNMSQTWHQVRPGEVRTNCGGCHAHSQIPVDFEKTAAASKDYKIWDLTQNTPLISHSKTDEPQIEYVNTPAVDVEFYRDIRPILQKSCVSCHQGNEMEAPGRLSLDDTKLLSNALLPNDYARLCADKEANWGYPPVLYAGKNKKAGWNQTNASRYIRMFQSRRSLLTWKLLGKRVDGWTNAEHPTETVIGDPSTIPVGANTGLVDIDYTGTIMPPPDSSVEPLDDGQKLAFIRWIDLGCPIDTAKNTDKDGFGWFLDETRPTLTINSPKSGKQYSPITSIIIGFDDYYSGIDLKSFSVTANVNIDEKTAQSELSQFFINTSPGVYEYVFKEPINELQDAELEVSIKDKQGNINRIIRSFSVNPTKP